MKNAGLAFESNLGDPDNNWFIEFKLPKACRREQGCQAARYAAVNFLSTNIDHLLRRERVTQYAS